MQTQTITANPRRIVQSPGYAAIRTNGDIRPASAGPPGSIRRETPSVLGHGSLARRSTGSDYPRAPGISAGMAQSRFGILPGIKCLKSLYGAYYQILIPRHKWRAIWKTGYFILSAFPLHLSVALCGFCNEMKSGLKNLSIRQLEKRLRGW